MLTIIETKIKYGSERNVFYSKSCCFIPVGWCRLNLYSKKYPSWAIGNIFIYMYIAEKDSVKFGGTDFKTVFFMRQIELYRCLTTSDSNTIWGH